MQYSTESNDNPPDSSSEARFGARIRELRIQKGLSQRELAGRLVGLNLDPTAITRIEKGARALRLGESLALAHALGTSVEAILQEIADPFGEIGRLEAQAEEARRMARAYAMSYLVLLKRLSSLKAKLPHNAEDNPTESFYRSVVRGLAEGELTPIYEPDHGTAATLQTIASMLVHGMVVAGEQSAHEDPDHADDDGDN